MKNMKSLMTIMALTISTASLANVKAFCISTMNSTQTKMPIVFDLVQHNKSGTWSSSEASNLGMTYSTSVEVNNGVITKIGLGHADGEGGMNREIHPNTSFAVFEFSDNLAIVCNVGSSFDELGTKLLHYNMEN